MRTLPFPKSHAPTYGEALPIPLATIVARTLLSEPLRETVAAESCPLLIVLRHRTPNSPIYLSEEIHKPLRLIASIPLIQRGEKCPSREEKSAFP